MRDLVARYGRDRAKVCAAYAAAEREGRAPRLKNKSAKSPEEYAEALWRDGDRRGWF